MLQPSYTVIMLLHIRFYHPPTYPDSIRLRDINMDFCTHTDGDESQGLKNVCFFGCCSALNKHKFRRAHILLLWFCFQPKVDNNNVSTQTNEQCQKWFQTVIELWFLSVYHLGIHLVYFCNTEAVCYIKIKNMFYEIHILCLKTHLKCYVVMLERKKKINAQLSEYDEIMTACIDLSCALGLSAKLKKLLILAVSLRCNVFFFSGVFLVRVLVKLNNITQ